MRKSILSIQDYVQGIQAGDRVVLGRAITLAESQRTEHRELFEQVMAALRPPAQPTVRIAITGAPGAGKSTFIEALGCWLIEQGKRVAVLAIDPSSALSYGSILGDKTRMERLSVQENAFIRPSPAGDALGGIARKTRDALALVEAAGYDVVLVETVGVGQSEVAARHICDLFVLLLLPGAGDELQGIKRGIVEMADLLVVNKADGDRKKLAALAQAHYIQATHLLPMAESHWAPRVRTVSALEATGLTEFWADVEAYQSATTVNGYWTSNRQQQSLYWLDESLKAGVLEAFFAKPGIKERRAELEQDILAGRISPFEASKILLSMA